MAEGGLETTVSQLTCSRLVICLPVDPGREGSSEDRVVQLTYHSYQTTLYPKGDRIDLGQLTTYADQLTLGVDHVYRPVDHVYRPVDPFFGRP